MRTSRLLTAAAMLILGASLSFADTITVTLDPKTLGSPAQGGVVVAPYYLDVHSPGDPAQGLNASSVITVICDDYVDHVTSGEVWNANVTNLASGNLSNTYFTSVSQYEQGAWLLMQTGLFAGATPQHINGGPAVNNVANINFAIWALFEPNAVHAGTPGYVSGASTVNSADWWLAQAQNLAPTTLSYYSGVDIITPIAPNGETVAQEFNSGQAPQEYLTVVPTPEPSSILMIAGGGLLFFGRLRKFVSSN